MRTRIFNIWTKLQASFWFVPSIMVVGAMGLSFAMIWADQTSGPGLVSQLGWLYTNKPEGAREVLSTIAGSMITVAGVVFSITIVALSLASSQFGPRILSNFMRDTGNQVVLGTFISTFFYCLLVLRTIRSGDETAFVPHLSVGVGVLLAICSLIVLIYFIHHVSESIQVSTIISRVDQDYHKVLTRLFPEKLGKAKIASPEQIGDKLDGRSAEPVVLSGPGYLQALDQETMLKLCSQNDLIVKMQIKPGDYAIVQQPVAEVYSKQACDEKVLKQIAGCFLLGKERTLEQDMLFPVNQLTEIAVRALSPGVNDPFTALACINRLTNGLCELAGRENPSPFRKDPDDRLRIIAPPVSFSEALCTSFEQIRLYGKGNPALMRHMLQCLHKIANCLQRPDDKEQLLQEAHRTLRAALKKVEDDEERTMLQQEFDRIEQVPGRQIA